MKIICFSDSHGNIDDMILAREQNKDADLFLHLGDMSYDFDDFKSIYKDCGYQFEGVSGNCDYDDFTVSYKILFLKKKKILITHGHNLCVNHSLDELKLLMKKQNIDLAFFGHTHVPMIEPFGNRLIINPGSISRPRQARPKRTYARVILTEKQISPEIVSVR